MDLVKIIRNIPDYPKTGIIFRDITTVLQDPISLKASIDLMAAKLENVDFDIIIGPESRGFIFGVPLAYNLKKGFVPVRKKGKLPYKTISKQYDLEYGTSVIEIHQDALIPGQKVVIIDDLLATGGTAKAIVELVQELGAIVTGAVFLIELEELKGRDMLEGIDVHTVLKY